MRKILFGVLMLTVFNAGAQYRYLLRFTDKSGTEYEVNKPGAFLSARSVSRRASKGVEITEQDLPVSAQYLHALQKAEIDVLGTSKWLNAALIDIPKEKLQTILDFDFVAGLEAGFPNGTASGKSGTNEIMLPVAFDAGTAQNQLEMLGADLMHDQGFRGEGVLVGVFDSGFQNANLLDVFKNMFAENRVIDTYDFVNKKVGVYDTHNHGTHVLSCIAADLEGKMIGTAPKASVALYITEDWRSETQIEEWNWLMAAERADSLGVDIISTSLGYNDFEGTEYDYVYSQLDGKTALITRAANWAASKGIVVVVSAGNEGNEAWKHITPPADSPHVIAVAAVDAKGKVGSFSSLGPTADNRIKPDVAAKGVGTTIASALNTITLGNGTSYAAPLISGLLAGFIQAFPDFSASQIRDILIQSASQFSTPDNMMGYGIPHFGRAYTLARIERLKALNKQNILVFPNPSMEKESITVLVTKQGVGSTFNLELYNSMGQKVFSRQFKSQLIELSKSELGISAGLYFVKVFNGQFEASSRVIVF